MPSPIEQKIKEIIAHECGRGVPVIIDAHTFLDLGITTLSFFNITQAVKDEFGAAIDFGTQDEIYTSGHGTIGGALSLIKNHVVQTGLNVEKATEISFGIKKLLAAYIPECTDASTIDVNKTLTALGITDANDRDEIALFLEDRFEIELDSVTRKFGNGTKTVNDIINIVKEVVLASSQALPIRSAHYFPKMTNTSGLKPLFR